MFVVALNHAHTTAAACQCGLLKQAYLLYKWHLFEKISHRLILLIWGIYDKKILCVITQWRVDEVIQLQPNDEGRSEHHYGDDILQDDEQFAKHHLGAVAEIALHNVNGLIAGYL